MSEVVTFDLEQYLKYVADNVDNKGFNSMSSPCSLRKSDKCPFIEMKKERHCGSCEFALNDQRILAIELVRLGLFQNNLPTKMWYMPDKMLYSKYSKGKKRINVQHFNERVELEMS